MPRSPQADPAGLATIFLHYERWGCVKVFGKQEAKRMLGGDSQVQIKLTPQIDENNTELRLVPETGGFRLTALSANRFAPGLSANCFATKCKARSRPHCRMARI